MPAVRLLSALLSITGLYAQTARPAFRPDRVIPSFGDTPLMLAPGMLVSIHGSDLGPAEGCRGYGDQRHWETLPADNPFGVWERIVLYPTLLCDVRVTVGDIPAGLLWVQAGQINFEVPKEVPFGGSANLRVTYAGVASDPAPLRFGLERIAITQDEPAYAGMPVWVRVHTANDLQDPIQYPLHEDPLRLACEEVEVRRNGVPLPRQAARNAMMLVRSGNICGVTALPDKPSKSGRLPLHLYYRFDQPGAFEVRFTRKGGDGITIRDRSAWTAIEVLPAVLHAQENRASWLRKMAASAPKSASELLSDYLPSLMGYGDAAALPLLMDALYDTNDTVRQFTEYGLADYYDRAELVNALRAAVLRKGWNEASARFLNFLTHTMPVQGMPGAYE